jgi:hypothetical protein
MAHLEFMRELRPHFVFWLLEKAMGAVVITAILAAVQSAEHHLDAATIGVVFLAALLTLVWIDRKKRAVIPAVNDHIAPQSIKPVIERAVTDDALKKAPSLLVHSVRKDNLGKFVFSIETGPSAIICRVWPLVSRERYEGSYPIDFIPGTIPPVSSGMPVECTEISSVTVSEILRRGTLKTSDTVVIDYDDSQGNKFSRFFTLTQGMEGTVAWIPGPICLRDRTLVPDPEVQGIVELREKLERAQLYPKAQQAAQQYARELQEERAKRESR